MRCGAIPVTSRPFQTHGTGVSAQMSGDPDRNNVDFPAPLGPMIRDDLMTLDVEVDIIDRSHAAERVLQTPHLKHGASPVSARATSSACPQFRRENKTK